MPNATTYESARSINIYLTAHRTNLLTNPSFETDTAGWTAGANSTFSDTPVLASSDWWVSAADYDAANDRLTDLSGNNNHARLGSIVGADTNDPTHLVYAGEKYSYHPGIAGNYVSTPDANSLDITGDIDIRCEVAPDDWTPAAIQTFIAKRNVGQISWQLRLNPAGNLSLIVSQDGGTVSEAGSSVAVGAADGSRLWVRATWRQSDGRVQHFTSPDGTTWTQLGTDVFRPLASLWSGTAPVEIGSSQLGTIHFLAGKVYRAIVKSGIDGTTVADYNPELATSPYASFNATTGEVWTFHRSASGKKLAIVDRTMLLFGTDDYLEVADNPLLDFAAGESFSVVLAMRMYAGSTVAATYLAKKNGSGTNAGYVLRRSGAANNPSAFEIADGAVNVSDFLGGTPAPPTGVGFQLAGVRNTDADTLALYEGGVASVPETDPTTATLATTEVLRVGRFSGGAGGYADMELFAAALFRRALTAAELATLATEMGV